VSGGSLAWDGSGPSGPDRAASDQILGGIMRKFAAPDDLTRRLEALRSERPIVDAATVAAAVEEVVSSLTGSLSLSEIKLYQELETLALVIQAAKREIAMIQPHDIPHHHIPLATDELDAVVAATAAATGVILDEAEVLEKLGATLQPEARAQITDSVTKIFEASNFQDITGQRITKVVKTLRYIETKIHGLLEAFGDQVEHFVPPVEPEPETEADADRRLMAGPQLPGNANSQADIDAILAGLF
jgi:chemotaxis protein CheZ